MIDHVAVVIPARNEGERLAACLSSVRRALRPLQRRDITTSIVVLLDSCTDDSAEVVARFAEVMRVHAFFASVGAARAAGVRWALDRLPTTPDRMWIASTDADSTVPRAWLTDQLALADSGADVVLGGVEPVWSELSAIQRAEWQRTHPDGVAVGNVHGANLGVRASAYLAAGGFETVTEDEDVRLVEALRSGGAGVATSTGAPVRTSGRSIGRAPSGYAGYLRSLESAS